MIKVIDLLINTGKGFSKTIERFNCTIARLKGIWFEILFLVSTLVYRSIHTINFKGSRMDGMRSRQANAWIGFDLTFLISKTKFDDVGW